MADELNQSPAPKKSGNEQAATAKSGDERNSQPDQKIKPRKLQSPKWLGLTKSKWREIAGFAVLIPWIYNDLVDSHNYSKLVPLAFSLAIAQGVLVSFLKSRHKALIIWFISLVPLAFLVWLNSRPEPKLHPRFEFSLCLASNPGETIKLTNDFLTIAKYSDNGPQPFLLDSVMFLPRQVGDSNATIRLFVKNNSFADAESPEITIGCSSNWNCAAGFDWQPSGNTFGIERWVSVSAM